MTEGKGKFVVTYMTFSPDDEPFVVEEDIEGVTDPNEVRYLFQVDHPDATIIDMEWIDLGEDQ